MTHVNNNKTWVKHQAHASSSSHESAQKLLGPKSHFNFPIMPKKQLLQQSWLTKYAPVARAAAAATVVLLLVWLALSARRDPAAHTEAHYSHAPADRCTKTSKATSSAGRPGSHTPQSGAADSGAAGQTIWRRPAILLLGDSITELGEDDEGGWGTKLGKAYRRKSDVINRGFSGYNTMAAVHSLPEILGSLCVCQIVLALVWLGANDAAIPGARDGLAHVPLDTYAANLENLVRTMQSSGVQQVVLVTPPPVWEDAPKAKAPGQAYPRTFNVTSTYAVEVRKLAANLSVPLFDVWQLFTNSQGWQQQLLSPDGIHLSKLGQAEVFKGLMQLIEEQLPSLRPSNMPWHHPNWRKLYEGDLAAKFAAEQAAYVAEYGMDGNCNQ